MGFQQVFASGFVGATEGFWFLYEASKACEKLVLPQYSLASMVKLPPVACLALTELFVADSRNWQSQAEFSPVFPLECFYHFTS